MLQAVIFDMDGVVIESEPLHHYAYHSMFKEVHIEVSDALYESFTGKSTINVCKQVRDIYNLKQLPEELVAIKRHHFDYIFNNNTDFDLIEGVLDLIKDLHSNGITLVLASSATMPSIERIFKRFDLNQYFIAKLSGADLKQSKPHPEIFINAVKASGYHAHECIIIEDSTNGIAAAKDANVFCIGYDSFFSKNQDYSKADFVLKNFNDINFNKMKDLLYKYNLGSLCS